MQLTLAAASVFVARAQLAKKVVAARKDASGVAAMPLRSFSQEGKEEEVGCSRL